MWSDEVSGESWGSLSWLFIMELMVWHFVMDMMLWPHSSCHFNFEVAEFSLQSHRYVSWVIVTCLMVKCGNCDSSWVPDHKRGRYEGEWVLLCTLTSLWDCLLQDLELFEREAKVLKSLKYPSIPEYIDYFQVYPWTVCSGTLYSMERVLLTYTDRNCGSLFWNFLFYGECFWVILKETVPTLFCPP